MKMNTSGLNIQILLWSGTKKQIYVEYLYMVLNNMIMYLQAIDHWAYNWQKGQGQ